MTKKAELPGANDPATGEPLGDYVSRAAHGAATTSQQLFEAALDSLLEDHAWVGLDLSRGIAIIDAARAAAWREGREADRRGDGDQNACPYVGRGDMKTCAICKHCCIDVGARGWSDATPGGSGSVTCARGHQEIEIDEGRIDLRHLAAVAQSCPDFTLLKL